MCSGKEGPENTQICLLLDASPWIQMDSSGNGSGGEAQWTGSTCTCRGFKLTPWHYKGMLLVHIHHWNFALRYSCVLLHSPHPCVFGGCPFYQEGHSYICYFTLISSFFRQLHCSHLSILRPQISQLDWSSKSLLIPGKSYTLDNFNSLFDLFCLYA